MNPLIKYRSENSNEIINECCVIEDELECYINLIITKSKPFWKENYTQTGFGSHVPILKYFCEKYNFNNILEYGMGFDSTNLFLNYINKVYSIEQQSEEWYIKVTNKYQNEINLKKFFPLLEFDYNKGMDYVDSFDFKFDFIFVDGCAEGRVPEIHHACSKTNLIITHDTEEKSSYHWDCLNLYENWFRKDYNTMPQTTIFTTNKEYLF